MSKYSEKIVAAVVVAVMTTTPMFAYEMSLEDYDIVQPSVFCEAVYVRLLEEEERTGKSPKYRQNDTLRAKWSERALAAGKALNMSHAAFDRLMADEVTLAVDLDLGHAQEIAANCERDEFKILARMAGLKKRAPDTTIVLTRAEDFSKCQYKLGPNKDWRLASKPPYKTYMYMTDEGLMQLKCLRDKLTPYQRTNLSNDDLVDMANSLGIVPANQWQFIGRRGTLTKRSTEGRSRHRLN